MRNMGWALATLVLCVFSSQAVGHSVKWHNGKVYDYAKLLDGKSCCSTGGGECRPAYRYKQTATGWRLWVPKDSNDINSETIYIDVLEINVTYQDLGQDGVAHTCASFSDGAWSPHCTFIPRAETAENEKNILDAALRRPTPGASFFFNRAIRAASGCGRFR